MIRRGQEFQVQKIKTRAWLLVKERRACLQKEK